MKIPRESSGHCTNQSKESKGRIRRMKDKEDAGGTGDGLGGKGAGN